MPECPVCKGNGCALCPIQCDIKGCAGVAVEQYVLAKGERIDLCEHHTHTEWRFIGASDNGGPTS